MRTRRIGNFDVSAIGLGCMSLSHGYGAPPPRDVAEQVLLGALDAGYTHFDTAALYGMGRNEQLLGEVLSHRRSAFFLASKCGLTNGDKRELNGRPEVIRSTLEQSLKNLRTDMIDLYYLHRYDKKVPIEESVGALGDLVREGKIRGVGLSEVSAATLRRAHAAYPITAVQNEYSPWTRNPEIALLDACRELGVGFVAFSPVARGFLAGSAIHPEAFEDGDLRKDMPRFVGEDFQSNLKLYEGFEALAREVGYTPAQLSLAWVLHQDEFITPIPGTSKPAHMMENAGAAEVQLSQDILDRIDALVNQSTVRGHRYAPHARPAIDTEEPA